MSTCTVLYRLALAAALLAVAVLATSCFAGDHVWGSQRIGISSVDHHPTLSLFSCSSRRPVTGVTVVIHNIHADVDRVVWQIVRTKQPASGAPHQETVAIGTTPTGYRTVVPLNGALPSGTLDVKLDRGHQEGVVRFSLDQLTPRSLLVAPDWYDGHQFVSQERFDDVNRRTC